MRRASSDCAALPEQVRLWSVHPRYLDQKGLVALWREGLLAQAVIRGETRGYKHHPQLARFRESVAPEWQIAGYLTEIHAEAVNRGYSFDAGKIASMGKVEQLVVTRGQLEYEWLHLKRKLSVRAQAWLATLNEEERPDPHPAFRVIDGGIAGWEVIPD